MSRRTHLRTPCREKERNARCDGGMLARSCSERDSGFQRTKNVPARRDELSSISCPTQWTPCHRARTSAFCRARRKCDLPPSESLLPVTRLVTEKRTIYASWSCCKRALHRTPEFLTKSQEHRAVPPRRPTFSFRPPPPVHTDGAGRGTSVCPNRARIAQDLGSPGGTDCAACWEIGIRRCCQESIEWTG